MDIWTKEISNALNDITNILHSEYEMYTTNEMAFSRNILSRCLDKLTKHPDYRYNELERDFISLFYGIVTTQDSVKFAKMLYTAFAEAVSVRYYRIRIEEDGEIGYHYISEEYGHFNKNDQMCFVTKQDAEQYFMQHHYETKEEAEERYHTEMTWE